MHRRRAFDRRALDGSPDRVPVVAAVLPAFRTASSIRAVIDAIPASVRHVIVVDDASPDGAGAAAAAAPDPRLVVLTHATNRGVGGAMKTGFERALELGADIVVKIDSDGQMDPALIPSFVAPLVEGRADLAKGNRFEDLAVITAMPPLRRAGNLALSFLVKAASGYWSLFDPCNGYVALRADLLRRIRRDRLAERYFFEISLLCEAYRAEGVAVDVGMHPRYGDEISSLSPMRSLFEFSGRLLGRIVRRIGSTYFLRDFSVVSVFITAGVPLLAFGVLWSAWHWYRSWATNVVASTGTVMIGTLAIILAFQLLLQAVVLDVQNEPGRPSD
jgi:glycosyltransferase involved in cell wall biosynthesis